MINLFLKKWHKQFENVKSIVSYINDSDFFHIITLELISALNDFDDGQNYDELNEELGKHMYLSLFGDSITLEKLKVLDIQILKMVINMEKEIFIGLQ